MEEDKIEGQEYLAEQLEKAFNKIEGLKDREKLDFLAECSHMLPIIRQVTRYGMWAQYDLLAKFHGNLRLDDLARGGINALAILQEFFEGKDAEYHELINSRKPPSEPNNPMSEPITTDGGI